MPVSEKIRESIEKASWVRKMFEEGIARKDKYGMENVFDFSLGNPNIDPPEGFKKALRDAAGNSSHGVHRYMPNSGFFETRKAVADYLSRLNELPLEPEDVLMTVGASGALNIALKTILNPGEEVIVPAPYFVEYNFYIDNHGGIPRIINTKPDFSLDIEAIEEAIVPKTKAVLINNPNNPTGKAYGRDELLRLGEVLTRQSRRLGEPIYLIADEPYRKIVYDGFTCPQVFQAYRESFLATSFSKDLALPGERIGYLAVHPEMRDKEIIQEGLVLCTRTLGYVNAPALMQRIIPGLLECSVDVDQYQKKRDTLCEGLKSAGYKFNKPQGTFYLFPETPVEDDVKFVQDLQEENILTVPGSGFRGPGHFRIAFCVEDKTIERALPGFARVMNKYR